MKITDIVTESTTAGSIATVASPMTTQSRNASIYGDKKVGNLLTGKKTNKKYANSVNESEEKDYSKMSRDEKIAYHNREMNAAAGKAAGQYQYHKDQLAKFKKKPVKESKMKQLAMDLKDMDNGNFKKKYGKDKEQMKFLLGDPEAKKTVHEAHLEEDDLILVPGQGRKMKTGFIPHGQSRIDHEVEMARSDLFSAAKNAKQVYELIADLTEEEGLEGWVQEKIIKANDYLNTIREYLEGKQLQQHEMTGGVIAGGGVGESIVDESKFYVKPHGIRGAKGKYLVHGIERNALGDGWEVRVGKSGDKLFHISDDDYKSHTFYDMDQKPMFVTTVAKKLQGAINEAQSMGTALKNTLAKAEPGSKLDNSIKSHNRDIKNGGKGTLKNAPTGYHFDKKGYCRLGDK